ncbi:hypothetical protein ACQ4PT_029658 [Festuca glaucescens]
MDMVLRILHMFGRVTGLHINMAKCSIAPIRCANINLETVLTPFVGEQVDFPIRYLGLPLCLGHLRHVHLQHVLDRARSHLASWKGRWVNAGGRKALVSSILSAWPIFAMIALRIPPRFLKEFDKLRRNFIWDIEDNAAAGGKCKGTALRQGFPDSITWMLTKSGVYSTSSAYKLHFEGQIRSVAPAIVWQQWAPAKCKIFLWLLLQNRLWCADRLLRRQWLNEYLCPLFVMNLETSWHLFFECPFTKHIWSGVAAWTNCDPLAPTVWENDRSMTEVWHRIIEKATPKVRKGIKSLFTLTCWCIWRERNTRIFKGKLSSMASIIACIRDEAREWAFTNAKALRELMFDPP